jgi:hypothetical protein
MKRLSAVISCYNELATNWLGDGGPLGVLETLLSR